MIDGAPLRPTPSLLAALPPSPGAPVGFSKQIDRELALSYATNRTNLQLRLETQGTAAANVEALKVKEEEPAPRRSQPKSDFEDLLER